MAFETFLCCGGEGGWRSLRVDASFLRFSLAEVRKKGDGKAV